MSKALNAVAASEAQIILSVVSCSQILHTDLLAASVKFWHPRVQNCRACVVEKGPKRWPTS